MTVRLLVKYGEYPPNSLLTTGAAEEARLLREAMADTNIAAGTAYSPNRPARRSDPLSALTVNAAELPLVAYMEGREVFVQETTKGTRTPAYWNGTRYSLVPWATNAITSDGQLVSDWSSALGTLTGTTLPAGASVALDTDGSMKITLGSGTGALFIDYVFNTPITLAQLVSLQIPIKYSANSPAFSGANRLEIELSDTVNPAAAVRRWRYQTGLDAGRLRPNVYHTISAAPGAAAEGWTFAGSSAPTSTTDMDAVTIARIRFVLTIPASSDGQTVNIGIIRANARRKSGLTIRLDGNYASQHNYILPMLEAQGLRASLAISCSTIGAGGRMTAAQLDRAYAAGHEIVLRCFDDSKFANGYSDAANFPTQADIMADINAGWAYMQNRGWTRGLGYLGHGGAVHPYAGTVTPERQAVLTAAFLAAGVKAASSVDYNAVGNLNRTQSVARTAYVDPLDVLGCLQWSSTNVATDLVAVATRAKGRGEWGLVTGHESVIAGAAGLQMLNSDIFTAVQSWGADVRSGALSNYTLGEGCQAYGISL